MMRKRGGEGVGKRSAIVLLPFYCLKNLRISLLLLFSLCLIPWGASANDKRVSSVPDCDINSGSCVNKVGSAQIMLTIEPKPVKAMQELTFTVTLKGAADYKNLRLSLQMPAMYMGNNEVKLVKTAPGIYTGKGVIPKCHSGNKVWSATVELPGLTPSETPFTFNVLY